MPIGTYGTFTWCFGKRACDCIGKKTTSSDTSTRRNRGTQSGVRRSKTTTFGTDSFLEQAYLILTRAGNSTTWSLEKRPLNMKRLQRQGPVENPMQEGEEFHVQGSQANFITKSVVCTHIIDKADSNVQIGRRVRGRLDRESRCPKNPGLVHQCDQCLEERLGGSLCNKTPRAPSSGHENGRGKGKKQF